MSFFSAPSVRTSNDLFTPEQKPEQNLETLQSITNTYRLIPGTPSREQIGGIVYPEINYAPSWFFPQFSTPQLVVVQPLSGPGVTLIPSEWSQAINQANTPKNTLAATGVTSSLRAPGINEGM